jgi:putative aldouronate transport system permease protein
MKRNPKTKNVRALDISYNQKQSPIKNILQELRRKKLLFFMILPAVIFFVIFSYTPMLGIILAFKRYNYTAGMLDSPWVGWDNFKFLYNSGTLWRVTRNTVLYNVAFIILDLITQVGTAILLNEIGKKAFKKLTQSMMFLPYFISAVLLASFIYNIFSYEQGTLNNILETLGFAKFDAYNNRNSWIFILLFFHVWKSLGYGVVVYLATITGISSEFYEAARVDGATRIHQIKYITIPLLKPTMIIITLFAVGRIMKGQFELFYQIIGNNGILYPVTDIIDTYVFRMTTTSFDPGIATAAGLYQSAFGFLLIVVVNAIVKKMNSDYALF